MHPKKLLFILPVLLLVSILIWKFKPSLPLNFGKPTPTPFPTPMYTKTNSKNPLKWGVFAGGGVNDAINFQQKIGQQSNYLPVFIHWGNENNFPYQFAEYATLEKQTIVIYWEAMDYNYKDLTSDKRYSYDEILSGTYDKYITDFAASLKKYGRPVILVPFEEMNGDWYSWSVTKNGNTPAKHVAAYRYIHKFFNNSPNVKFAWVVNYDTVPDTKENQPQTYFPGNAYVDYVGVNGFNFGEPWQSFDEIFSNPLSYLKNFNKPIIIFSMASAQGPQKAAWIKDAADKMTKYPIVGWIWFNENKEKDWRIWSDNESLKAFQEQLLSISDTRPLRLR
jgi:hypothetical protein